MSNQLKSNRELFGRLVGNALFIGLPLAFGRFEGMGYRKPNPQVTAAQPAAPTLPAPLIQHADVQRSGQLFVSRLYPAILFAGVIFISLNRLRINAQQKTR